VKYIRENLLGNGAFEKAAPAAGAGA
jgi:hypothetical protein